MRALALAALLAVAPLASALESEKRLEDGVCYQVANLKLDTKILPIRDWLVSYGAQVRVGAEILFKLYIPPQLTEQDAEQIVRRVRFFGRLRDAKVIRRGMLHKGVDFGNFTKSDLQPLVALLLEAGYAPAMQPVYNAKQQPMMRILEGHSRLNLAAFATEFPGHELIPFLDCGSF